MKKFDILEHKADLKIRVFGKTKEKIFENAMIGMQSALRPKIKKQKPATTPPLNKGGVVAKIKKIKIESLNLETLLVDFLSEVLYLIQVNKEIYNDIKFKKLTDIDLEAEITGKKVERFDEDIKAVTYHDLDIYQRKDGIWEATILFDI